MEVGAGCGQKAAVSLDGKTSCHSNTIYVCPIHKRLATLNAATVTIAAEGVRHDHSAKASLRHQSH